MPESKQFHEQPFSKTCWLGEKVLKIRATGIIQIIFQHSDLQRSKQQLLLKHKNNSRFLRNYSIVMFFSIIIGILMQKLVAIHQVAEKAYEVPLVYI